MAHSAITKKIRFDKQQMDCRTPIPTAKHELAANSVGDKVFELTVVHSLVAQHPRLNEMFYVNS